MVKSLWIVIAFIPFINGLGFAYIGAKEFNSNWIKEGLIYEIPWFLQFIFVNKENFASFFAGLGLLFMLICIIRTFMVYFKNKDVLIYDDDESRIDVEKSVSSYWVIFSVIIFLNGLGLIFIGFRRNIRRWILEGAFFEFLWVLYFIFFNTSKTVSNLFISIALIGWVLSIVRTFMVYFEEERLDSNIFIPPKPAMDASNDRIVTNSAADVKEDNSSKIIPQFRSYFREINELKGTFSHKEENLIGLIEKRFDKEELTYDRFMSVIGNCNKLFNHQADSALSIIDLAPEYSLRLDETIKGKISIMEGIIDEMNTLIEEFIIHDGNDDESNNELNELFENMDNLINSVKDYK